MMNGRSVSAGVLIAIASVVPLSGTAHAQDLDCRDFVYQEDAQAVFDSDPRDPHRLDEDRGPDDGIACEVLPRRAGAVAPQDTPAPRDTATPQATVIAPAASSSPVPARGVRGGLGGASEPARDAWWTGAGLTLAAGAAVGAGWVVRRRRHT
ncbi:excalibur calcium-binding protein [Streptomyces lavendofoliae]|uniref:excalibur calcium-binding protein n=1 Tax=Streptomyces lavendofoliae TaxID=67314 RepID=UPI003D8C36CA